jgi:hypothetical protein
MSSAGAGGTESGTSGKPGTNDTGGAADTSAAGAADTSAAGAADTSAGGAADTGGTGETPPAAAKGRCTWVMKDPSGTKTTDIGCHWDSIGGGPVGLYADNTDAATGFSILGLKGAPGTYPVHSQAFGLLGYVCFGDTCSGSTVITANDGAVLTGTFTVDFITAKKEPAHVVGAFAAVCDGTAGTMTTCPTE